MNIIPMSISDTRVLELFSEHNDYMINFLGADKDCYTRYSAAENIKKVWAAFEENMPIGCVAYRTKTKGCTKLFLDTRITLEPAVSLYRSFGFEITFRQGLYIQMEMDI